MRNPMEELVMDRQPEKMILADLIRRYGTITVSSGHGGRVYSYERDLLKHYRNREVINLWVDPVDCHAYVTIK